MVTVFGGDADLGHLPLIDWAIQEVDADVRSWPRDDAGVSSYIRNQTIGPVRALRPLDERQVRCLISEDSSSTS